MARLGIIELDQLPAMKVLEDLSAESIILSRMTQFVAFWKQHDPPAGAVYDVEGLEFDPIRILQEANAYFELLLRDRINQAAKSVTLAFGSDSDLDAIASRYPGGVPRLPGETDDRYRTRIWLSANMLSPHGVYEAYVFWALTAVPTLRDATAVAKRGTANVTITIMAEGLPIKFEETAFNVLRVSEFPSPIPTTAQVDAVRTYVGEKARKGLTDVVSVRVPKLVMVDYVVRYWLFPGWDKSTMDRELWKAFAALLEQQRWLGYSHVQAAVEAALKRSGVFNVIVDSPADTIIAEHEIVFVRSVKLIYAGRGGFEAAPEP